MRCVRFLLLGCVVWGTAALGRAQQTPAESPGRSTTIHVETRLVLVDAVVTDKKGNYVNDLTAKDFRVWEDGKEQAVKSFSLETSTAAPETGSQRFLVLFFDVSTMAMEDQVVAHKAAAQFIDANAGPNRQMAVVNFTGVLRIAQNFTADTERLKRALGGPKAAAVSPTDQSEMATVSASVPAQSLGAAAADFGVRTGLMALRNVAKGLARIPGRKTLVWLTAGFELTPDQMPEVRAAISECNKANVAIYPIDVRGLVPGMTAGPRSAIDGPPVRIVPAVFLSGGRPYFQLAAFSPAQRGGNPGGGTRGGTPGGGRGNVPGGGTRGGGINPGGTMMNSTSPFNRGFNRARLLIPQLPSTADNQQIMQMLAEGTGGFIIRNTNDLLSGLQRIARDQDQYYLIGYAPVESSEGSCHGLHVKVDRGGTTVRSRSMYCDVAPQDQLAGDPIEEELEQRVAIAGPGDIPGSLVDPFFYTAPNTARVNVAMDIPGSAIKAEKVKGRLQAEINVLGIAYTPSGAVAARFSDTVKRDFENKQAFEEFAQQPLHYENQFDIAAGSYLLKVVFGSGHKFGKLEMPLVVDAWDGKEFSLSDVAFSKSTRALSDDSGLDADLLQGRTPLVASGVAITPAAVKRVKKDGLGIVYVEVYEPHLLDANPPQVLLRVKVLDRKTGALANDVGSFNVAKAIRKGSPVIPVGLKLPVESLAPGAYRAELRAMDSSGRQSVVRTVDFDVEP
jgi:VWFA-related protein